MLPTDPWAVSQRIGGERRWWGMELSVALARGGDRVVHEPIDFDSWVAARGPALLRLAYTLSGDRADAEDAVQDALARALPRWERLSRLDDVEAYVRRMVVNAHTSRWRRFRRRESPVADPVPRGVVAGPGGGVAADERAAIWAAGLRLPDVQRVAVVLRYYEDLEYAEIAALTGVREGSARSRVSRGLAALRADLSVVPTSARGTGDGDA